MINHTNPIHESWCSYINIKADFKKSAMRNREENFIMIKNSNSQRHLIKISQNHKTKINRIKEKIGKSTIIS